MFIIKLRMLDQRSHECEVEDLEAERDIELSLDLLQEGLSEPLTWHFRVGTEQVSKIGEV